MDEEGFENQQRGRQTHSGFHAQKGLRDQWVCPQKLYALWCQTHCDQGRYMLSAANISETADAHESRVAKVLSETKYDCSRQFHKTPFQLS